METPGSINWQAFGRKLQQCLFLYDIVYFLSQDPCWPYGLTLIRYHFETEAREPKPNTFSESWVGKDFVSTSPKKISQWTFSGTDRFTKNSYFFFPISGFSNSYISETKWLRHQQWVLNWRILRELNCKPILSKSLPQGVQEKRKKLPPPGS